MRKFFVRGLGIAVGTGDVVTEMEDLQFTNYNLQFGAEGTTKAARHQGITVAAIGDRGVATATLECGSEAAALSEGAQLPYDADSTRNRAGSATVATAVPSRGSHAISASETSSNSLPGNGFTSEGVHFYLANHRGDTVMVVEESGVLEAHLQYDAFGNVTARSGNFAPTYTFSTKEHLVGANLYAYAYRVYDPHAGRWTQRDPIDYQDSVNLYQFCGNNPVTVIDTDGRILEWLFSDPQQRNAHRAEAVTWQAFMEHVHGMNLGSMRVEAGNFGYLSDSGGGGPHPAFRYVIDPGNSGQVIDMRHFLVIGRQGELPGLLVEILQLRGDSASAFDHQDFLSNALGARFYTWVYMREYFRRTNLLGYILLKRHNDWELLQQWFAARERRRNQE